jgi:hypothetical protein
MVSDFHDGRHIQYIIDKNTDQNPLSNRCHGPLGTHNNGIPPGIKGNKGTCRIVNCESKYKTIYGSKTSSCLIFNLELEQAGTNPCTYGKFRNRYIILKINQIHADARIVNQGWKS